MILHPGILALLCGSAVVFLMVAYASLLGIRILRKWDFSSSSAGQLALERRTYLISTLMNYALGFQAASMFLFIFTADDIHKLFVGAMCATGSLNANPVGWYALISKVIVFFMAGVWIAVNHVDQRAVDYPLVKAKNVLLMVLLPVVGLDLYLLLRYFLGLNPDIITSCCGTLFSEADGAVASSLASLPVYPTMVVFYSGMGIFLMVLLICLKSPKSAARYAASILSVPVFIIAAASLVSFISVYIYELPTHHCPFDILQAKYGYLGYALYLSLFGGVYFGMLPGIFQPMKDRETLRKVIERAERKWVYCAVALILVFVLLSTYPVVFGSFSAWP